MNEVDAKNFEEIKKLVGKYFSLTNSSYRRFESGLTNPSMANAIKELFKDSDDFRLRFKMEPMHFEGMDDAWKKFQEIFSSFTYNYDVSYKNFLDNKVMIDKNQIKLKKAMLKFYSSSKVGINHAREVAYDWDERNAIERVVNSINSKTWEMDLKEMVMNTNGSVIRFNSEQEGLDILKGFVDSAITKRMEYIGTMKVSSKHDNLEIVITRNFADWFLASTGENWTSCLSLYSDYEGAYWSGLPGTIVDPNRIMIYVTNGTKKNCFGVEVDHFLQRSWVILDNEGTFRNLRWYDSKKVTNKTIKAVTGINLAPNSGQEFTSELSFEPLEFSNSISCFPYQDNSRFSIPEDGEVYIIGIDEGDMCIINSCGYREFDVAWDFNDYCLDNGLQTLIDNNMSLSEWNRSNGNSREVCYECGCSLDVDDVYQYDGEYYCEDCFHEKFVECEHCGRILSRDSSRMNCTENGEWFCDRSNCTDHYEYIMDKGWYHHDDLYKIYNEGGEHWEDRITFDYSLTEPEGYIYIPDLKMHYPEEMCTYLPSENVWWTNKMIEEHNDLNQLKLDFRSHSEKVSDLAREMVPIMGSFQMSNGMSISQMMGALGVPIDKVLNNYDWNWETLNLEA